MKKLFVLAALLMASTAAHAGNSISLDIEGHHVQVSVPRNCSSLSCLQISAPGLSGSNFGFKSEHEDDDDNYSENSRAPAPAPRYAAPQPVAPVANVAAPASAAVAPTAPVAQAPVNNTLATVTAAVAPTIAAVAPTIAAVAPAPATAPVAPAAAYAAPAPVASAPVVTAPVPVAAAAPVSDPNSPLGVWATEESKGNVSIEQCGPNLCGYAVKSGEKILINMKPQGSKWTGRIRDPDSGSDYDSTIAMKGTNALKVQGCAFGGMFCGGQTWKRVS
jgi:uncharacterized protein (DUF2147 family)